MAVFPGAVADDEDLYLVSNNLGTVLTAGIDAVVTTIPVVSTTGFPTTGWITIDQEAITYTGITATDFTGCTRGAGGTVAASHLIGAGVKQTAVAAHHNSLKDEIIAIETYIASHLGLATVVTAAEFERLAGVTSPIQDQLDDKANDVDVVHLAGIETITGQKTMNALIATLAANLAAAGFKISGLGAGTVAGDSVRYEQAILASGVNPFAADQPMGGNKLTGLGAGTANGDSLRYEQLIGLYLLLTGGTMSGNIAMGTNKITGLGNGTAVQDAAAFGQVKILQVVQASATTEVATTSGTHTDTGLTANITPSNTANKVLVIVAQSVRNRLVSQTGVTTSLRLTRDSTDLIADQLSSYNDSDAPAAGTVAGQEIMIYLDSPATTSSTTYKTRVARFAGTGTSIVQDGSTGTASWIILIEVNGL